MICYRCWCFYHRHRLWSATGAAVAFITDIVHCLLGSAAVFIIGTVICHRFCCCFYHWHCYLSQVLLLFLWLALLSVTGSTVVFIIGTIICHRFCCLHQHILNVGTQHKAIFWGRKNDGMDAKPRMGSHGSWWWDRFFQFYCYSCLYNIYVTFTEIKVFFGRQARFSGSSSSLFVLDLITNIWRKPLLLTLVLECQFSAIQRPADFILHKLQFFGMACEGNYAMPQSTVAELL